ncbi:hypothetical protein ACFE04_011600 [Oxalis oulophora]
MEGSSNTVPSIVVYVTVPSREAGKKLAQSIVKEKLAACVNIVPGMSSFTVVACFMSLLRSVLNLFTSGKGSLDNLSFHFNREHWLQIETDSEELLIIKTRQSLLDALTQHVKANHDYDTPEVIALPITGGSQKYLEWLKQSTRE